jgi:hypothetical protein
VPVVIVVYMIISVGCMRHYLTVRRDAFNPLLHLVLPLGGIVLFFFPLYYQYVKAPPTYPIKAANWIALAWLVVGAVLAFWLATSRPERLQDVEHVYVDDEA